MISRLRLSHSEHLAVCTVTLVKDVGDEEQISAMLLGVRGIEDVRRWPPGVEGTGVLRWTRIAGAPSMWMPGVRGEKPLLVAILVPGVLGGMRSLGIEAVVGVVGRDMVDYFGWRLWW